MPFSGGVACAPPSPPEAKSALQVLRMPTQYHHAIPTLWLVWCLYWCISAIGTKAAIRRESATSRLSHMAPLAFGFGLLVSPRFAGSWLTMPVLAREPAFFWPGFSLVAIGLGFSAAARAWLGGNWSGAVTLKQDHQLIRSGPYRFVRHPIYTGLLLAALGTAIAEGEWRGLAALALIAAAFLRKIAIEENFLTEQFGASYARYRAEVPALIPRLR